MVIHLTSWHSLHSRWVPSCITWHVTWACISASVSNDIWHLMHWYVFFWWTVRRCTSKSPRDSNFTPQSEHLEISSSPLEWKQLLHMYVCDVKELLEDFTDPRIIKLLGSNILEQTQQGADVTRDGSRDAFFKWNLACIRTSTSTTKVCLHTTQGTGRPLLFPLGELCCCKWLRNWSSLRSWTLQTIHVLPDTT